MRTPREQLWNDLHGLFVDETAYYAGPDVGFDNLAQADVERLWEHIYGRAASIGEEAVGAGPEPWEGRSLKLPEAVRLVFDGEIGYLSIRATGIRSHGALLPDLWIELWKDAISFYWWVSHPEDNWNSEKVAALVRLLDELRQMVPGADLEYEYGDPLGFWRQVDNFLKSDSVRTD